MYFCIFVVELRSYIPSRYCPVYSKMAAPESSHYDDIHHHHRYYSYHKNVCQRGEYRGGVQPASDISTSEGSIDVVFSTGQAVVDGRLGMAGVKVSLCRWRSCSNVVSFRIEGLYRHEDKQPQKQTCKLFSFQPRHSSTLTPLEGFLHVHRTPM